MAMLPKVDLKDVNETQLKAAQMQLGIMLDAVNSRGEVLNSAVQIVPRPDAIECFAIALACIDVQLHAPTPPAEMPPIPFGEPAGEEQGT